MPEITTRLHLHLNGGDKYSQRIDHIFIDGELVEGMSMGVSTNGSPDFKLESKELIYVGPGDDEPKDENRLDLLACHLSQEDINDWILARAPGVREVTDD